MATALALRLPEILQVIFEFAWVKKLPAISQYAKQEDVSILLVNRLWYHEAIRVVWRRRTVTQVMAVRDLSRRQRYAKNVGELSHDSESQDIDPNCDFPRLEAYTLQTSSPGNTWCPPSFLRSNLLLLGLQVGAIDDATMDLVSDRFPNLKGLGLFGCGLGPLTSRGLLKALERLVNLKILCIHGAQTYKVVTKQALCFISRLSGLQMFLCNKYITLPDAMGLVQSGASFAHVQRVHCSMDISALNHFAPHMKHLSLLTVTTCEKRSFDSWNLKLLTSLEILRIEMPVQGSHVDSEFLLALLELPNLRSFRITKAWSRLTVALPIWEANEMEQYLLRFPRLESFDTYGLNVCDDHRAMIRDRTKLPHGTPHTPCKLVEYASACVGRWKILTDSQGEKSLKRLSENPGIVMLTEGKILTGEAHRDLCARSNRDLTSYMVRHRRMPEAATFLAGEASDYEIIDGQPRVVQHKYQ